MINAFLKLLASHGWLLLWLSFAMTFYFAVIEHGNHTKAIASATEKSAQKKARWKRRLLWLIPLAAFLQATSSQLGSDITDAKLAPVQLTCIDTNVANAHEKGWEARLTFQNVAMEKPLTSFPIHAEADEPVIAEITIGNATLSQYYNGGKSDPSLKMMDAKSILANPPFTSVMIRVTKPTTIKLTSPNFEGEKLLVIQ